MINFERDLYPLVEKFLIENKNCVKEYVGNELHMGSDRRMRADVYGYYRKNNSQVIYLLEGKHYLDGRSNFSKVLCEAIPILEFADYVYIFGMSEENFELQNKKYYDICKRLGIGILILNENGDILEILKPEKNIIDPFDRKEILFRIFLKGIQSPIANLILQATGEYIQLNSIEDGCVPFIEVYNELFSKSEYKDILDQILNYKYALTDIGMRKAFQKEFGNSKYVKIQSMNRRVDDYICIKEEGIKLIKEPILLRIIEKSKKI
ncbi:hypothetical protein HYG87_00570 [Methanobacterium alkalithermotolerans]|uniref:Uncharacterized protein n=1 Tax=Methanobacterium alkalithermotolerans TaxID=2731220 RepID=A0A8T8K341_9EURY|nr:hypothetical protein [Methanobacterium alkalithermotolerans]QUH22362.1 hypothetical protein HYG87_00570 [Methanobacterium alkalithermotolerans]